MLFPSFWEEIYTHLKFAEKMVLHKARVVRNAFFKTLLSTSFHAVPFNSMAPFTNKLLS